MSKNKILYVLEATLGGTRLHVMDLLKRIDLEQFDVVFIYSTSRADKNFFIDLEVVKQRGIKCIKLEMDRNISPINDIKSFFQLIKLIKYGKFDLVHLHSSKAGFLGRLAAKIISNKIITIYTPNSMSININKAYLYLEKIAVPFTNRIIAVSASEKDEIIKANITNKVSLINSGVKVYSTRQKNYMLHDLFNLNKNLKIVVSIGRLSIQKDPMTFLNSAKYFNENFQDTKVNFIWIGDGEKRKECENFIKSNKLNNVFITGWRTDVDELLWGTDIFLLTSIYESFGYVTCEAMSHFLPTIGTDVSGTRDIIVDGKTGFLVDKYKFVEIANKIKYLLENEEIINNFGIEGHKRVNEMFNVDIMVQETESLYLNQLQIIKKY